jgi:hypothetical protein
MAASVCPQEKLVSVFRMVFASQSDGIYVKTVSMGGKGLSATLFGNRGSFQVNRQDVSSIIQSIARTTVCESRLVASPELPKGIRLGK